MGKIWNANNFDIITPPLTLAKKVLESYLIDTLWPIWSYIGNICIKCCQYHTNISPIYHQNQGLISVIWIYENLKINTPLHSSQNILHFRLWTFLFVCWSPPPFGLLPLFGTFFVWTAPLNKITQSNQLQSKELKESSWGLTVPSSAQAGISINLN